MLHNSVLLSLAFCTAAAFISPNYYPYNSYPSSQGQVIINGTVAQGPNGIIKIIKNGKVVITNCRICRLCCIGYQVPVPSVYPTGPSNSYAVPIGYPTSPNVPPTWPPVQTTPYVPPTWPPVQTTPYVPPTQPVIQTTQPVIQTTQPVIQTTQPTPMPCQTTTPAAPGTTPATTTLPPCSVPTTTVPTYPTAPPTTTTEGYVTQPATYPTPPPAYPTAPAGYRTAPDAYQVAGVPTPGYTWPPNPPTQGPYQPTQGPYQPTQGPYQPTQGPYQPTQPTQGPYPTTQGPSPTQPGINSCCYVELHNIQATVSCGSIGTKCCQRTCSNQKTVTISLPIAIFNLPTRITCDEAIQRGIIRESDILGVCKTPEVTIPTNAPGPSPVPTVPVPVPTDSYVVPVVASGSAVLGAFITLVIASILCL